MKVEFTKASENDNYGVTVRTNNLFDPLTDPQLRYKILNHAKTPGNYLILTVGRSPILFKSSRDGETLYAAAFPGKKQPTVGNPVVRNVISIEAVTQTVGDEYVSR